MGMFGDLSKVGKGEFAALIRERFDAWQNLITGLGTVRDKRLGAKFTADTFLDPQSLESLYNGDDMAYKAVELIVADSLKNGYNITSGDADNAGDAKDEADEIKQLMDSLCAEEKVAEAATWGRLYGAGGILLGARDGKKPTEELVDDDVVSLDFLTVLELRDMYTEAYYADPMKPSYGQPMIYRIQPVTGTSTMATSLTQYVHASRIIMFEGARTSRRTKISRQGWSLSVLQRLYDILRDANANWSSISHLMTDANLAVMKVKGFLQMIAGKDIADMQTRLEMVDMAKSVARAYVCDADSEDYERKPTSFAGYPEILDRTWQRLASAMPETMPVTKLIGISAAGMNANGEGDERMWGNSVEGYRQKRLKTPFERIARLCARTIGASEPDSITVTFPPYRQLTPQEEADRRQKVATTDQIYITAGVWLPEEVATARVKGGAYSADPPIVDLELRERVLNKQLAAYEANAGKTLATGGNPAGDDVDGTKGGQANATTTGGGDVPADASGNRVDDFDPSKHPRAENGEFGQGGGSESKNPKGSGGGFNARDVVASAVKNGGFTVDLAGKAAPSEGYGVSPYPEHERKIAGNMTAAALKSYRDDKADFVKADPTRKIGGWYNVKDDTWYLDVSHVVKDRDEAVKIAKAHKQLAIYNFKSGESESTS